MFKLILLFFLLFFNSFSFAQEPSLVLPIGHTKAITGVKISPDQKYMVTSSMDNTGKIWNYRTGKFMYDLILHTAPVISLQMSTDGKFIVLASQDGSYSKWETATGKLLFHSERKASIKNAILLKGDTSILLMKDYVMVIGGFTAQSEDFIFDEIYEEYPGDIKKRMALSADGKLLALHQKYQELKIFDIENQQLIQSFDKVTIDENRFHLLEKSEPEHLFFSHNNQLTGSWGGYFTAGFDIQTGKQNFFQPVPMYYPDYNNDNSLVSFKNGRDDSIRVWDTKLNTVKFIIPNEKKLSVVKFKEDGKGLFLHKGNLIQEWSINGVMLKETHLRHSIPKIDFLKEDKAVAHVLKNAGVETYEWGTGEMINDFSGKIPVLLNAAYSANGQWLFELKENYANYWQLSRMKAERFPLFGNKSVKKIHLLQTDNQVLLQYPEWIVLFDCRTGNVLYSMEANYNTELILKDSFFYAVYNGKLKKWETASGKLLKEWQLPGDPASISISSNDSMLAYRRSFRYGDTVYVFNLHTNKITDHFYRAVQKTENEYLKIYTRNYEPVLKFSPDSKKLFFGAGNEGDLNIARLAYDEINSYDDFSDTTHFSGELVLGDFSMMYHTDFLPMAFNKNDSLVYISRGAHGSDEFDVVAMDNNEEIKWELRYNSFQRIIYLDETVQQLHTATRTEWLIWDLNNKKIVKKIALPAGMKAIVYNPDSKRLLVQSNDRMGLVSAGNDKPDYFFSSLEKAETISYRSDRFYKAGPSIAKWFSWNLGDQFYDFDQWDLQFNRPDKLMELTAEPDKTLKTAYYNAYLKRLNKNELQEKDLDREISLPQTTLLNTETDGEKVAARMFNIKLSVVPANKKSPLKNIQVWVNDNPVWGRAGYSLPSGIKKAYKLDLNIPLSAGINKIKVSCIDKKGNESLRKLLNIHHVPAEKNPVKTWFIGIGINHFADSTHNLQWSVKDIADLAVKLKEKYNNNIHIDTLFDASVTKENVLALKSKLMQSGVDDKVIIAYSGHGLLSNSFDYYLSTYTVDFKMPEREGLSYESLEDLTDGIPARKKLLLMDACHSGEIDKEEMQQMQDLGSTIAATGIKGVKPLTKNSEPKMGMKNSFQLMQELFSGTGSSTGATTIAAAAGTQFALERNSLQNGIFTYAILEMMQQYPTISVSGLHEYVSNRVQELTKGLQIPSARKENHSNDWNVW